MIELQQFSKNCSKCNWRRSKAHYPRGLGLRKWRRRNSPFTEARSGRCSLEEVAGEKIQGV